jgi:hypothetical protein
LLSIHEISNYIIKTWLRLLLGGGANEKDDLGSPLKNVDKLIKRSLSKDFGEERQCFNEVTFHPSCLLNILIPGLGVKRVVEVKNPNFLGKIQMAGRI